MTLRQKIWLGYIITFLLLILTSGSAGYYLLKLGNASQSILSENYLSIIATNKMLSALESQNQSHLMYLMTKPPRSAKAFEQSNESHSEFLLWFGRARDNITISGEEDVLDKIGKSYNEYVLALAKTVVIGSDDQREAYKIYEQHILPYFNKVQGDCMELRELNENTMFDASLRTKKMARYMLAATLVIGGACLCFALIFSFLVTKVLVRPIQSLHHAVVEVGRGNLNVQLPPAGSDEVGVLTREFNRMVHELQSFQEINLTQIISEKRKSEAIIRTISDGILVIDRHGHISIINPVALRILGIEYSQAMGRSFREVAKMESLADLIDQTNRTGKSPAVSSEESIITITGEFPIYFRFFIHPIVTEEGETLGTVVLMQDVTALKQVDRLKSEFVMTASHELKTPLTTIKMGIDLLIEESSGPLTEKQKKLLAAISEETERMTSLIMNLLDLSKIESGRMEMEIADFDLKPILTKALNVMKAQADEKKIVIRMIEPEFLPQARADPSKILWVIINLIGNAIRYTKSEGFVELKAYSISPNIHVSVQDNGIGIPLEYQSRIFDKFVQIKGQDDSGGSGLGLAIAKEIIKANSGTIWVESQPGKGSTFIFTIPMAARQEGEKTCLQKC